MEVNICGNREDVISRLPDLVQDKMFGFLGVRDKVEAAQVCPLWRDAVYRPCQWKEVKVRVDLGKLSEADLSSFTERRIRHLQVDNFFVQSHLVDMLHEWLVFLDMSRIPISLSSLQKVFCKSFTSLKKLCMLLSATEPLESERVQDVFQHLSDLEHLDLIVENCNNDVVQAVGEKLKKLKDFSLRAGFRTACNLEFLHRLSSLQSLSLEYVTASGIDCLKSASKTLKKVSLTCCHFDTAEWLEILLEMSFLEELKLNLCTPAGEGELRQLTQGLRNLKVLTYSPPFYSPFNLDLWSLAQMANLEEFSVANCRLESDDDVRVLSDGLQNLRSLRMRCCHNLSAAFMKGIAGLPSLQELSLDYTSDVNDTGLEMISSGCCQLRKLELRGCSGISCKAMKHVAVMSSLRELTLYGLRVDSSGMEYLKNGRLSLEALSIEWCDWSFQDVKPWLKEQRSLQRLTFGACWMPEADKNEAENLKKLLPFLRYVDLL